MLGPRTGPLTYEVVLPKPDAPLALSPTVQRIRLGGWCPPGGTPRVAIAALILSSLNPSSRIVWTQRALSSLVGSGIR